MNDNLINILQGKWRFERQVKEFEINMVGTAEFVFLNEFTLGYEESGNYAHQQNEYNFFQKYQFLMQPNKLLIIKNDGSVLHEFTIPEITTYPVQLNHIHECGQDHYSCQLILQEANFWQMFYVISGHNKNYSIKTSFHRI